MANIFYQKLKCLLSVASNVYLIKLILQLHMNKKSNLLLGFVKLLLYFCTESWILLQKCAMCGRVLSLQYHGELQCQNHGEFRIMCVRALSVFCTPAFDFALSSCKTSSPLYICKNCNRDQGWNQVRLYGRVPVIQT